jgi:beta-galactosidase
MYYGADYYPEHWPPERWSTDARLMREAGINLVRMGEFAWAQLEPQEGSTAFAWLDEAIRLLAQEGIATVLGTPTAAPPAWLSQRYPETLPVDREGRRVTIGNRRQYCPSHPTYRALARRIVTEMARHYAGNPHVIGWQIDNEFSGHCYCPACQQAFQAWVQRRYDTLAALNEAWGTAFWSHLYSSWSQIPLPWATSGVANPGLELDYWRFTSDQFVSFQQEQLDILRALCPERLVTTNFMGFHYQDLNYYDLARPLDVVAWDNYPIQEAADPALAALGHATMRGLKNMPFWVMEQQAGPSGWQSMSRAVRPGQLRLWAYQSIAHGADALVYFRWRSCRVGTEQWWHGILDHDGQPRRRYAEVQQMGQELARLGRRLMGTATPPAVALLLSYEDSWALRLQPNAAGLAYKELFASYYRPFYHSGLPVDVVSPDADLSPYRLVIAPTLYVLPPAWVDKLRQYVEGGGYLVVGARSGVKDIANRVVDMPLPGLLSELLGIEIEEYDALGRHVHSSIRFEAHLAELANTLCPVHTWCDVITLCGAEVIARYAQDYYAGRPAITRRRVGRGTALYVGTMGGADLYATLARWLAKEVALRPLLATPSGVEVAARESNGLTYLFVLNHTDDDQMFQLPYPCTELLAQQPLHGSTTIGPHEVMILVAE